MAGVERWPSYEEALIRADFGCVDRLLLGLPEPPDASYRWVRILHTDEFYEEAVTQEFRADDRKFWGQPLAQRIQILNSWPWLLLRPRIRTGRVLTCGLCRERRLALTAIEHSDLAPERKPEVLTRVRDYLRSRRVGRPGPLPERGLKRCYRGHGRRHGRGRAQAGGAVARSCWLGYRAGGRSPGGGIGGRDGWLRSAAHSVNQPTSMRSARDAKWPMR